MTGRVANGQKSVEKWCQYRNYSCQDKAWQDELPRQTLPAYGISQANSYLDWVASAVARHPEAGQVFAQFEGLTPEQYGQGLGYMQVAMGRESQWQVHLIPAGDICQPGMEAEASKEILEKVIAGDLLPAEEIWTQRINRVLDWQYDFQGTEKVPAKLSVSELKRRFGRELEQEGTDYELLLTKEAGSEIATEGGLSTEQQREYNYPRPVFLQRQQEGRQVSRSTEYGTLMHSVMQHLDLTQGLDRAGVEKQLEEMVYREIITQDQLSMVNTPQVAGFFASPLGQRMLQADKIWREMPFCRMLPAERYFSEVRTSEAEIFNQGVIDVLFQEKGKLVLIDYKTDRNTNAHHVKQLYSLQLELYSQAVESVLNSKVAEKYLYMLRDGSIVKV